MNRRDFLKRVAGGAAAAAAIPLMKPEPLEVETPEVQAPGPYVLYVQKQVQRSDDGFQPDIDLEVRGLVDPEIEWATLRDGRTSEVEPLNYHTWVGGYQQAGLHKFPLPTPEDGWQHGDVVMFRINCKRMDDDWEAELHYKQNVYIDMFYNYVCKDKRRRFVGVIS